LENGGIPDFLCIKGERNAWLFVRKGI
jgi:hypothetical protein